MLLLLSVQNSRSRIPPEELLGLTLSRWFPSTYSVLVPACRYQAVTAEFWQGIDGAIPATSGPSAARPLMTKFNRIAEEGPSRWEARACLRLLSEIFKALLRTGVHRRVLRPAERPSGGPSPLSGRPTATGRLATAGRNCVRNISPSTQKAQH